MKTEKDLNDDILRITQDLEEMFPELAKYLGKAPSKVAGRLAYYNSLNAIFTDYATIHEEIKEKNKNESYNKN